MPEFMVITCPHCGRELLSTSYIIRGTELLECPECRCTFETYTAASKWTSLSPLTRD